MVSRAYLPVTLGIRTTVFEPDGFPFKLSVTGKVKPMNNLRQLWIHYFHLQFYKIIYAGFC